MAAPPAIQPGARRRGWRARRRGRAGPCAPRDSAWPRARAGARHPSGRDACLAVVSSRHAACPRGQARGVDRSRERRRITVCVSPDDASESISWFMTRPRRGDWPVSATRRAARSVSSDASSPRSACVSASATGTCRDRRMSRTGLGSGPSSCTAASGTITPGVVGQRFRLATGPSGSRSFAATVRATIVWCRSCRPTVSRSASHGNAR